MSRPLRLPAVRERTLAGIERASRAAARELEAAARRDAPWRDRTGLARRSITGVCERAGQRFRMGVGGFAPYSAALENGNDGQNAVLGPTVHRMQGELLRKAARLPRL